MQPPQNCLSATSRTTKELVAFAVFLTVFLSITLYIQNREASLLVESGSVHRVLIRIFFFS